MDQPAQNGSAESSKSAKEAKKRLIDKWSRTTNPESGAFEFTFGDPVQTPYAIRLAIYYNESGEQAIDIAKASVEGGYFEENDSFSAIEMASLKTEIAEALPLMYQQLFEFGQSVYQALLAYDSDESFTDADYEEYSRLSGFSSNGRSVASKNGKSIANLNSELHDMPIIDASKLSATVEFKFEGADSMTLESYLQQAKRWPGKGQHILGTFTDTAILVYQAFSEPIASYAVREQKFTGAPGYSTTRMTWIKPNFLWMMYRSNWARSSNQERILGIWVRIEAFHDLLRHGIHSSSSGEDEWQTSPIETEKAGWKGRVVLQWDPDHGPNGNAVFRRAIQIGVKNVPWWHTGEHFERIFDVTPLVASQRDHITSSLENLYTPQERIYHIRDKSLAKHMRTETTQLHLNEETAYLAALAKTRTKKAPAASK